jgi:hypothetical protein
MGVFVLLFGVWYCYKRGREERLKSEKEVLVDESTVDASVPSVEGMSDGNRTLESTPVVSGVTVDDTPLQVESDPVPVVAKKTKKNWLTGKAS